MNGLLVRDNICIYLLLSADARLPCRNSPPMSPWKICVVASSTWSIMSASVTRIVSARQHTVCGQRSNPQFSEHLFLHCVIIVHPQSLGWDQVVAQSIHISSFPPLEGLRIMPDCA